MTIIIIGGSFAGITAAKAIRKKHPLARVLIIDKKTEIGFIPGGIQLYLNQQISALEQAFFVTPEELIRLGIDLQLASQVTAINTQKQTLTYRHQEQEQQLNYDKLILATGSEQHSSSIPGINNDKIIRYKSLSSAKKAVALVAEKEDFCIIGGGQTGVEMADALINNGKKVRIIESMDGMLIKYFDKEMLQPLLQEMRQRGVALHFNQTVNQVFEEEQQLRIQTNNTTYLTDGAAYALSVAPNLDYLEGQLRCHQDQTIWVDRYLQTSQKNVFAIGDCIQIPASLDQHSFHIALINNAVRTGIVVAENLEEPTLPFVGTLRTLGTHVFDYYLASTGLTESEGIFMAEPLASTTLTQPLSFFPGTDPTGVTAKLVYEKNSGKLVGAQLLSKANIIEKINTLALAIQSGLTIADLAQKDYLFQPTLTPLVDLTNQLGLSSLAKGVDS